MVITFFSIVLLAILKDYILPALNCLSNYLIQTVVIPTWLVLLGLIPFLHVVYFLIKKIQTTKMEKIQNFIGLI